jgi:hypothetical protein
LVLNPRDSFTFTLIITQFNSIIYFKVLTQKLNGK